MQFGQILTANVVQRPTTVKITDMDLVTFTRDNGLISFTMFR